MLLRQTATLGLIGAESPLGYSQRSRVKWLGLRKSVRRGQQQREVIEVPCHVGMVRAKALLIDLECSPKERLGFC